MTICEPGVSPARGGTDVSGGDEPRPGRELPGRVAGLVQAAREALQCGVILVVSRDHRGHMQVAGAEGHELLGADEVDGVLNRIERWANSGSAAPRVDALADAGFWDAGLTGYGVHHAMLIPIPWDGAVAGALLALRSCDPFGRTELGVAEAFARHFHVALTPRSSPRPVMLAALLRGLEEINRSSRVLEMSDLCPMLDEALAPVLGPVRTGLTVWDEEDRRLHLVSSTLSVDSWEASVTELGSSTVRVFVSGAPYVTDHGFTDPGLMGEQARRFGADQLIQIQLSVGDQPIGVMSITFEDRSPYDNLEAVEALAPHLASVIDFASTTRLLRRDVELSSALSAFAMMIAGSDAATRSRFVAGVARLRGALGADVVALVQRGGTSVSDTAGGESDLGRVATRVAETHPDGHRQRRLSELDGDRDGWLCTVPVALSGERIGTVVAARRGDEPFHHNETEALERLSNLAALAWSKARHWQQSFLVARMEERERLANDLHDDVAQLLFAAQVALDPAFEGDAGLPRGSISRARELLVTADEVIRKLIHERVDPVLPEFVPCLLEVVSQVEYDHGLAVELRMSADRRLTPVPPDVASALKRVVREALVNVAKHAGPCRAQVCVQASDRDGLSVVISDDGAGLGGDECRDGYGISSMRRSLVRIGGTLDVAFSPTGATVTARVPA
jgi:signal transduction histidine kinase